MNDAQARYERRGHVNHPKSSDYVMFLASNACLCFYTILLQNFHPDCQANVRLFMHYPSSLPFVPSWLETCCIDYPKYQLQLVSGFQHEAQGIKGAGE